MTSRDDAARAAVAPMLADLRGELLVMPREETVERHLNMMTFEQRVLATPRFVEQKTRRSPMPAPRRVAVAFICVLSTLVSCGLSAAGALPEPLQNLTNTIAHTLGVPKSDHARGAPSGHSAGVPAARKPAPDFSPTPTAKPAGPTPTTKAPAAVIAPTTTTTEPKLPGPDTQIAKTPAHPPAQPITPVDPGPPPSKNSSNTPPGYPTDWRDQATEAAAIRLLACANDATGLTTPGCPQSAVPVGDNAQVASATWTLLNLPEDGAVVIAKTQPGNPRKHIAPTTIVTVYEAFQMSATYTEVGGAGTYLAYSGGISVATMKWDGTSFQDVSFGPGPVTGPLPAGVTAPTIPKAPGVDDGRVLEAVQAGFAACTASPVPTVVPTCPQPATPGATWTTVGNPVLGAVVAYDSRTGLYTVTGSYTMTSDQGATATGPYTATLFFDNLQVWPLSISGA